MTSSPYFSLAVLFVAALCFGLTPLALEDAAGLAAGALLPTAGFVAETGAGSGSVPARTAPAIGGQAAARARTMMTAGISRRGKTVLRALLSAVSNMVR